MRRRTLFAIALGTAAVTMAATISLSTRPTITYTAQFENVLGTSMDLTVVAPSEEQARAVETAVLASVQHDAGILSSYDPASEFSRWFATRGVATPVSAELAEVLSLFDAWRVRTGGALDPSVEEVSRVWKRAAAEGRRPETAELAAAVAAIRQAHWTVDPAGATATHLSATPLVLNSFTKSYIVDRAAEAGLTAGATGIVVNIGGDIAVRGDRTETVAVRDPRAAADNAAPLTMLTIEGRAIATSGGYRRGFDINGRHYSHIVDPRSGEPTGHVLSATVIADDAVDAGALATALCVLTPEHGERLAAGVPGVEFLMLLADGGRIESAGWRDYEVPVGGRSIVPSPVATLYAAEQTWNPEFQLTVTLDLARPGFGARRPYVAVWIEDKDKYPVRTLALWLEKTRWLPDLRAWSRSDRLRSLAEGTNILASVSSATRAPGRYTLTWDGKDQQGKPVKPGVYTVLVEAAREHGTYQVVRQDMDFSGVPKHVDLPGGLEIASVALDYNKIGGR